MKRLYIVEAVEGDFAVLVKATTKASAVKHVAGNKYTATVASQEAIVKMVQNGAKVEEAGEAAAE